jgi:GTP-binding nuclear protein Ran
MSSTLASSSNALKVVIVGDPMVGKTSFVRQLCNQSFSSSYTATEGAEVSLYKREDGTILSLWDVSGDRQSLIDGHYINADAVVIMFDINNVQSYKNLHKWRTDVQRVVSTQTPIIIASTKSDIQSPAIQSKDIIYHKKKSLPYILTSAVTGDNIEQCIELIVKSIAFSTI